MKSLERLIRRWKYPYLSALILSIIIAAYLGSNESFKQWVYQLGSAEYLGALVAGFLFVSSFTIPISIVVIIILAQEINPLTLALVGGIGSAFGDYLIFRFIREHLGEELEEIVGPNETSHINTFLHSRYISWSLPIVGALVIASPLPDELGVGILGLSKISTAKFLLVSYLSNVFGILTIASLSKVL